jgi:hypothetical protein
VRLLYATLGAVPSRPPRFDFVLIIISFALMHFFSLAALASFAVKLLCFLAALAPLAIKR